MPSTAPEWSPRAGNGTAPRRPFRADIQGLRAFAVLAVLADHLFGWPNGGFIGVDVFFVISGFLITGLLLREQERSGSISFARFYERRIKRILPASLVTLAVTVVAAWTLLPRSRAAATTVDGVWSALFAGNWRFAANGTDYFQEGGLPSPLQHFWSLGVEEQFYFVWPWLLLVLFVAGTRLWGGRVTARKIAAVAMTVIVALSLIWAVYETSTDAGWAYFSTFSRAWELGVGALLAIATPALVNLPARLRPYLAWCGLAAIVAALFVVDPAVGFPAPAALLPVLGTALIIASGTGGVVRSMAPLANPVTSYIGNISFSLYLWHWPVIVLLVAVVPASQPAYYVLALLLSAALAVASFHLIEEPARKARWRFADLRALRPGARWALSATAVVVLVVGLGGTAILAKRTDGGAGATAAQLAELGDCVGAAARNPDAPCTPPARDFAVPGADAMSADTGNQYACWRGLGEDMPTCSLGSSAPDALRVALLGDSHAAGLISALEPIAAERNWHIDVFTGNGCQWLIGSKDAECAGPRAWSQAQLLEGERYDIAITTAARGRGNADGFAEAWRAVRERGTRVIAVADVPKASEAAIACVSRVGFAGASSNCGTDTATAFADPDAISVAAHAAGADLISLDDVFCENDFCPSVIGNVMVYRDASGHITATFMSSLAPLLDARIQEVLGAQASAG